MLPEGIGAISMFDKIPMETKIILTILGVALAAGIVGGLAIIDALLHAWKTNQESKRSSDS